MTIKKNTQHAVLTETQIKNKLAAQLRRNKLATLDTQGLDTEFAATFGLAAYAKTIRRQRRRTH